MKTKVRVLEVVRAKDYYTNSQFRKYLLYWTLLLNGSPVFEGKKTEVKAYLKKIRRDTDVIFD